MAEPAYEVVWPLGKSAYEIVSPAQRAPDLSGKTICELWDYGFRGDEMFQVIREQLQKRYPGIKFVDYTAFGNIHGWNERAVVAAIPDLLRKHRADAVITAVGA